MIKIQPKLYKLKYLYANDKEKFMDEQIELFKKEKYKPSAGVIPLLIQIPIILALVKVIENPLNYIQNIENTKFLGIDLACNPSTADYMIIPILSAISCILLCLFQNRLNVLQKQESLKSKLFTGILTTIITIYFVFVVPNGVGLYWTIGNILAIIQIYILNAIYVPNKYIDYEELEHYKNLSDKKQKEIKEYRKIEKKDYKRFLKNIEKKKLVFYSEQSGFYKYFAGIIEYILQNSNIKIHYITSDPKDKIFDKNIDNLKTYYIDKNKLIPLFMKLEAKIVVMTTPDLQKYYLKRSLVKKDIEYVYLDHGISSFNLTLRTGALDYYDTIFACGPEQVKELNAMKENRNMYLKNIVNVGSPVIDDLIASYQKLSLNNKRKTILIAPSYQKDNIMESCLDGLLDNLLETNYKIIVRPHPQFIRRKEILLNEIIEKYKDRFNDNFYFELDFSSNETVYTSDLIITDWSAIGFEYSFTTGKPCLSINTKIKIVNKEYEKIPMIPMEIKIRNEIGKAIEKEDIKNIKQIVDDLILNQNNYKENNLKNRNKYLYNIGTSGKIGAEYIINKLKGGKKEND